MVVSKSPSYLYHYTTLEGLHGVVTKRVLWASNIFYLNDTQEFYEGLGFARAWLEKNASEDLAGLSKSLTEITPGGKVTMPVFICSFSAEKDDLNQWRAYCPTGGVAIGFPYGDLVKLTLKQGTTYEFSMMKCEYGQKKKRLLIESELPRVVEQILEKTEPPKVSGNQTGEYRVRRLLLHLTGKSAALKNGAFKNEREWRLVAVASPGMGRDENIGFRCRNGFLMPYMKFRLTPRGDRGIWKSVRVIIGPHPHPNEMKASVEGLLVRYCSRAGTEATFEVRNSTVPYRHW